MGYESTVACVLFREPPCESRSAKLSKDYGSQESRRHHLVGCYWVIFVIEISNKGYITY